MLWPIVLPAEVTFVVLAVLVAAATVLAPRFRATRGGTLALSTLTALLVFLPSCTVVMNLLDRHRFGVFSYADFAAVDDFRVERFLPEAATEITVEKYPQGYRAKFHIGQQSLDEWFEQVWKKYGSLSSTARVPVDPGRKVETKYVESRFDKLNWPIPADLVEYEGPRAANGAGFTLWYSVSEGVAFQHAGYW
jgi:hypothetical protein